jgi:hypothetical protein
MQSLKKIRRSRILTSSGKLETITQFPAAYQCLLDTAAESSVEEAIRQGREDIAAGRTDPASEVFAKMRKKYNIPC